LRRTTFTWEYGLLICGEVALREAPWRNRSHDVSDKPSYLGLLNAISIGETEAFQYLNA